MKDKKILPMILLLVAAVIAVAAVIVFTVWSGSKNGGEEPNGTVSEEVTTPEETTPEETETEPEIINPEPYVQEGEAYVLDENGQILYGWYPRSLMETGFRGLEEADYDENNIAEIDGTRYMRVENGEGYDYYRFEMIKWNVVEDLWNGYVLISSEVVDCKPYNDAFWSVSWGQSSIYTWLNGYFYETAFSEEERNGIMLTELNATRNPMYGSITGEYMNANVYFVSAEDLVNPAFGYDVYVETTDAKRVAGPTQYAVANGIYTYSDGNCRWWTRTSGVEDIYTVYVNNDGTVGCDGIFVNTNNIGVRPVIKVSKDALSQLAAPAAPADTEQPAE